MFQKGDIVWMKTEKYPVWPGVIKKGRFIQDDGKYYYEAVFICDQSGITIYEGDVQIFDPSRTDLLPSQSNLKKYKNLSKALVQAQKRMQIKSLPKPQSKSKSISKSKAQIRVGNQSKNHTQTQTQTKNQTKNLNKNEQLIKKQIETSKSKGSERVYCRNKGEGQESNNASKSKLSKDTKEKPQTELRKQSSRVIQNQLKNQKEHIKYQRQDRQSLQKEQKQKLEKQRQKHKQQKEKEKEKEKEKQQIKQKQKQKEKEKDQIKQREKQKQKQKQKQKEQAIPIKHVRFLTAQVPKILRQPEKAQDTKISAGSQANIKQKQQQKQQLRELLTIKSLSRSTNTNPYIENKKLEYFQFRLQSLMFVLLDNSRIPLYNKKIDQQFSAVQEIFDISQIQLASFANSKICSILTLFLEKMSSKFSKRQLTWIRSTLDQINNRIISLLNDYSTLQSRNKFYQEQSILTLQQPSKNHQQILRRQYRCEIVDTLKNKISDINSQTFQVITQEILTFLQERQQRAQEGWQALKKLINSNIYVTCDECFRKVNEYMQSIGPI